MTIGGPSRMAVAVADHLGLQLIESVRVSDKSATVVDRIFHPTGSIIAKRYRSHWGGLPPQDLVRKNRLVTDELASAIGIRVPAVLGEIHLDGFSVLVLEDVNTDSWTRTERDAAAKGARRLHESGAVISSELQQLMDRTRPNRLRVLLGVKAMAEALHAQDRALEPWIAELLTTDEPTPASLAPIHGDYHDRNMGTIGGDVAVFDWDLLGWGDPMWDLAFLIAADRSITQTDQETARAAYGAVSAADKTRLEWHLTAWRAFAWLNERVELPQ